MKMLFSKKAAIAYLLPVVFLVPHALVHGSERRAIDAATAEQRLAPFLAEWQSENVIVLDPRLLRELAGEFVHAQGIFTYGENAKHKKDFDDDKWLRSIVIKHLDSLKQSQSMITTFFALLGDDLNLDSERSGWPSTKINIYRLEDYVAGLPKGQYLLVSDELPHTLGFFAARRFLVGPGSHDIYDTNEKRLSFSVPFRSPFNEPFALKNSGPERARGRNPR